MSDDDKAFADNHRTLIVTLDDSLSDAESDRAAEDAVATRDVLVARRAELYAAMDAAEADDDQARMDALHDQLADLRRQISDLDGEDHGQ